MDFDGLVCDMDGVIYRENEPVDGSIEAVAELRRSGVRVLFCSNNSRDTIGRYLEKLRAMGMETDEPDVLTSAIVTKEVLESRDLDGKTALVVGGPGLVEAVTAAGLTALPDEKGRLADVVAVGLDPGFSYLRLKEAALAVRAGALLVASNDDATFPAPDGLWPGAGSVLAAIERASGARAEVMGKPHAPMMQAAARRLEGCERIAMVGDRPETDLAGGMAMGWTTILVLTGVTSRDEVHHVEPKPDLVVERFADLLKLEGR